VNPPETFKWKQKGSNVKTLSAIPPEALLIAILFVCQIDKHWSSAIGYISCRPLRSLFPYTNKSNKT
jgi:hypothetical protein